MFVWLVAGLVIHDGAAQFHFEGQRINLPNHISNQSTRSYQLDALPPDLSYGKEAVSLVADFDKAENNRIQVYLINPKKTIFELSSVAMEIPIVLEAYLGNGHWERAESENTYGFLSTRKKEQLSPMHYRVKNVRHWSEGQSAKLRYALYQNGSATLVTEPFEGFLPIGEIEKARNDFMAAALVPEPLRIRYLPEQTTREEISTEWFNKLSLLRQFGPCYIDLGEAQKWAAEVHENPVSSREDRDLAIQLQIALLQTWPNQYDLKRLLEYGRSVLKKPVDDTAGLRPLCWKILADNAEENGEPDGAALAQVAWKTIQIPSTSPELEAASDFLCIKEIAAKHSPILSYEHRESLLNSDNVHLRIAAANYLISNKNRQQALNHYSANQSSYGVYELVRVLYLDRLHNPYETPNWNLWTRALDKDITVAFPQLSRMFESDETNSKLSKFSQSSDLPEGIRERLTNLSNTSPEGPLKRSVDRLLDDVNVNQRRSSGLKRMPILKKTFF